MPASTIPHVQNTALPHTPLTHKRIWLLTGPIILSNASVPLVGAVDTAVLRDMPHPSYIAGVALGASAISLIVFGLGFLRIVTGGLAAQAVGRNDPTELKAVFLRSMLVAQVLALLILLAAPWLVQAAEAFFPAEPSTHAVMRDYLHIRLWATPFMLGNMVVLALWVGLQKTGLIFALQILLNGCNIVLDLVFVHGLHQAAAGVAWASLCAEALAFGVGVVLIWRRLAPYSLSRSSLFDMSKFQALFRANTDMLIRSFALEAVFLMLMRHAGHISTEAVGATAIHMHFLHLAAHGLDGFAITIETLAGAAYGRRSVPAMREVIAKTSLWAGLLAGLATLAYWGLGDWFILAMTSLTQVQAVAKETLWLAALAPLVGVWAFQADGIFFGTTRTAPLRNTTLIAALGFNLASWLLLPHLGLLALWWSMLLFFALRAGGLALAYPALERDMQGDAQPR